MQITKILGKTSKILSEVFLINAIIVGIGLLTNILIARWFGQENFGIYMYFFSLTNLIYLFASFGLANYLAKLKQTELSRKLFIVLIVLTLISTFLISSIIYLAGNFLQPQIKFWFWLVFLYSFGITLFNITGGALRRLEKFRLAINFSLLNRIFLFSLIVISALMQNFWLVLFSMSIAILILWLSNVVVTQTFPWMLDKMNENTFYLYTLICVIAVLFVRFMIAETKGKKLEEIEKMWITK